MRATIRGLRLAGMFAVAGTGRQSGGRCTRHPRNISVKRALLSAAGTLRGIAVSPDANDDLYIAAARHRTWKRHRRTQWHI